MIDGAEGVRRTRVAELAENVSLRARQLCVDVAWRRSSSGCWSSSFVGAFAAQVATRVRLIAAAPNTFPLDDLGFRVRRFLARRRRCSGRRSASGRSPGLAHAFVFWGFVAFGGYTVAEFLHGLGIVDLTGTRAGSTPTASC